MVREESCEASIVGFGSSGASTHQDESRVIQSEPEPFISHLLSLLGIIPLHFSGARSHPKGQRRLLKIPLV